MQQRETTKGTSKSGGANITAATCASSGSREQPVLAAGPIPTTTGAGAEPNDNQPTCTTSSSSSSPPTKKQESCGSGISGNDANPRVTTVLPIIIPNDEIKPTDILLGRGSQHAQWEGNVRFRKIVKERRREYNSRRCKNRTKNTIAQEILDAVLNGRKSSLVTTSTASSDAATGTTAKLETAAPPGRFLEQVDADVAEKAGFSTDQCNWQVAGTKRTLDKIKMTQKEEGW